MKKRYFGLALLFFLVLVAGCSDRSITIPPPVIGGNGSGSGETVYVNETYYVYYNTTNNQTINITQIINDSNPIVSFEADEVSDEVTYTICLLDGTCFNASHHDSDGSTYDDSWIIPALNLKLDVTDQRYNESDLIPVNVSQLNNDAGYLTSYNDTDTVWDIDGSCLVNISGTLTFNPTCDTQLSEAQVDDYCSDNGYLTSYTETDPNWQGNYSGYNKSAWDTAYGWGNHASQGYLTSYSESDPIYSAWDKDYDDLTNKPALFDGAWSSLTGVPSGFSDGVDNDTQLSESQVDDYVSNNGFLTEENDPDYHAWADNIERTYLLSEFTVTDQTWTELSDMTLTLSSGAWSINCIFITSGTTTTSGIQQRFFMQNRVSGYMLQTHWTSASALDAWRSTGDLSVTSANSQGTNYRRYWYDAFQNTTGGNWTTEFRNEASSNSLTVHPGSHCEAIKIA